MIDQPAIYEALRRVLDPEVGVNIVDLGLIYGVACDGEAVRVDLTLTTPACPLSSTMTREIRVALRDAGVTGEVDVNIVWEPPWQPEMMTAAAREQLGWPAAT